ncbi:MAG TPA: hypothetical protein PK413_21545, partial [Thermoanaerobaculia bacterium]|nr:hypothetical protein [Thermoanaerobaculia bacterium]
MVARSEFSTQFAAFTVPSAEAAAKLAARLRQEPSVASVHSAADLALLGGFGGQALNSLTSRFVAADGRQAVYAYPRGDIWDPETRDRFVARMRALDPNVTGMPFLSRYMIDLSQRALTIAGGLALAILILCVAIDLKNLPLSRRQMVEIAKALGKEPKLLILDEATSALTAEDVERVYAIIRELKAQGVGILYVSHRMHEIEALADTATVFRNGRKIETFARGSRSVTDIIKMMIGRDVSHAYPDKPVRKDKPAPALSVRNLSWGRELTDISLGVGKGEIVGLGGLDGQGQRDLLLA